ncbi:light-independent protochlorophyllide reductase subunit B [Synechococcus sp. WH 7805]|nr:light-independent protochlorophyllide reductase subunit B [Synechococcus sp. WH 7805]
MQRPLHNGSMSFNSSGCVLSVIQQ